MRKTLLRVFTFFNFCVVLFLSFILCSKNFQAFFSYFLSKKATHNPILFFLNSRFPNVFKFSHLNI